MSIAVKVENVSKQYRLGKVGTGTFAHDLNRWWHLIRGKEDPYLKIGETNDRTQKGEGDYVWALKDINFEIKQGEAVGIIGRNGAGKSTLLKILSRTTAPSTGNIKLKGRVASLLEVGTGFHPELSGRENIYLNGAILGMTRKEITRKFDEIVAFAGVERYIDTPVKRYSSGMYVRLAFAVAAHLESEILIVDEVLAVGDAEFQKKCLGKMGEVSRGEGRTVLFVSHNMPAVRTLCQSGVVLAEGMIGYTGPIDNCVEYYSSNSTTISGLSTKKVYSDNEQRPSTDNIELLSYRLMDAKNNDIESFNVYEEVYLEIVYQLKQSKHKIYPNIHFFSQDDSYIFVTSAKSNELPAEQGVFVARFTISPFTLNVGIVKIGIAFTLYPGTDVQFYINPAIIAQVNEDDLSFRGGPYTGSMPGPVRINLPFVVE